MLINILKHYSTIKLQIDMSKNIHLYIYNSLIKQKLYHDMTKAQFIDWLYRPWYFGLAFGENTFNKTLHISL